MREGQKRYQVFVSSTYEDLIEERQAVIIALLQMDCLPASMELFPAATDDQWSLIKRVIDESDYYLVVLGGKYGSLDADGLGFTEKEYRYALQTNKPIIGFVHKDPDNLPARRTERTDELQAKFREFRELVLGKPCRLWTTPAELGAAISVSLPKLIRSHPAGGWIRDGVAPAPLPGDTPLDSVLKVVLAEDKPPAVPNCLTIEQCQLLLWDAFDFDVLWLKLVCSCRARQNPPPGLFLTLSPAASEVRDCSHMYFAMDSLLRGYQMPMLTGYRDDDVVSHVFYVAEPGKERERVHYAHPVSVPFHPARIRVDGVENGSYRLTPCNFLTYDPLVVTDTDYTFGMWAYCTLPKLLSRRHGTLQFSCRSHVNIVRFRFQAALPFGMHPVHDRCTCMEDLAHPWVNTNPIINYPGWLSFMSPTGQAREIPIFFNPEPGIAFAAGTLVYDQAGPAASGGSL